MPANFSQAEWLLSLPESERIDILSKLSDEQVLGLRYDWNFWARPSQKLPSGNWFCWLLRSGRGYGKSRTDQRPLFSGLCRGIPPLLLWVKQRQTLGILWSKWGIVLS